MAEEYVKICAHHGKLKKEQTSIQKYKNPNRINQLICKICKEITRKKYNEKYPGRARKLNQQSHKVRKFKISLEEFNVMKELQNNLCSICLKPETAMDRTSQTRDLCIDHCHKTGKVRGLLCHACNVAIGLLKDDITILQNAIAYLSKN